MNARGSGRRDTVRVIAFVLAGFGVLVGSSRSLHAFGAAKAQPEDCASPIDLRKDGLLSVLPSGEQGDTYACGFFVAGSLLDSFRIREEALPPGHTSILPIDPIALAIDLAVETDRPNWFPLQLTSDPLSSEDGRRGSYLCDIVQHVREYGVCDHGDPRVYDREWMRTRSTLAMKVYEAARDLAYPNDMEDAEERGRAVHAIRLALAKDPTLVLSDSRLEKILIDDSESPYEVVRKILYPQCEQKRYFGAYEDLPQCRTKIYAGWEVLGLGEGNAESRALRIEKEIHRRLESERGVRNVLPIPVLHCYAALQKGRGFEGASIFDEDCITHYVSVIGRRSKGGVCQFLVRNSYDPRDEEAVSSDWERDGEDFWVDASTLSRSTFGLHGL